MKIILVNTVCGRGSVGRITADLYETAVRNGAQVAVAYGRGTAAGNITSFKIGRKADFYRHVCRNFFCGEAGFGSAGQTKRFLDYLEREKPDILHLHNLHGFYLQIELLFEYIKKKQIPVVWTLHDCWPFTGHCAYYDKNGCLLWQEGCGKCRYHAKAYPYALFKDNAAQGFLRKKAAFTGAGRLVLVTPSEWLAGEVKKSFLKDYPVEVIPNGVDRNVFCPAVRAGENAKERRADLTGEKTENLSLKQPGGRRFTILGVANIWEERKGLSFFEELARTLPDYYRIRLIGLSDRQKKALQKQFPAERLLAQGRTDSIEELADAYREADVFVNPTLEDNFPTANLEALSCGTPVVTFQTGGSPETIGILPEDKLDFAKNRMQETACGVCVGKGNGQALAEAVRRVCEYGRRECSAEYAAGERWQNILQKAGKTDEKLFRASSCLAQAENYEKNEQYDKYFALYERLVKA